MRQQKTQEALALYAKPSLMLVSKTVTSFSADLVGHSWEYEIMLVVFPI